jgi:hypothetical protein
MTMQKLLKTMRPGLTVHGFRSAARDWAAERGVPHDVAEAMLGHAVAKTQTVAAYLRTDHLQVKRFTAMMERIGEIVQLGQTVSFRNAIPQGDDGVYGVIQARDIGHNGRLNLLGIALLNELPAKGEPPLLQIGDVVLQSRGTSFRAAVIEKTGMPLVASGQVYVLRPDSGRIDSRFLTLYLNLPQTQRALRQIAAGTYIPNITKDSLLQLEIPLPPLSAQRAIAELGDQIHRAFEIEQRLFDLRLTQLQPLISGGKKKAGKAPPHRLFERSSERLSAATTMSRCTRLGNCSMLLQIIYRFYIETTGRKLNIKAAGEAFISPGSRHTQRGGSH